MTKITKTSGISGYWANPRDNSGSGGSGGFSTSRDYPSSSSDRDHGPSGSSTSGSSTSGSSSYRSTRDWTGWTQQDYQEMDAIISRNQSLMQGFTGQVLGGSWGNDRHCREYNEAPQVNKEMLAAVRKIDSEGTSKSVNFMLFHKHYLNDDDMYWLSSIFNTHTPKGLAVNTVDLSNNCLTLVRDSNLGYVDLPFFSFNAPYNTPRNILRLDLSNNNIGDAGAKVVADGLANGVFPITKQINLSGNNITDTGKGFIANMMHNLNQGLVVTLETIQNVSKESFKLAVKGMLSVAKSNGVSTKEALTTEETIEHCKKGIPNIVKNAGFGFVKCFTSADTPIALYQKDMHSLLVKTTVNVINPLKKPMQFVCMTQETFFSVVDEDFANCLTGVDSGLDE